MSHEVMITKVIENRLRRVAARQGLELHKSRARDPRHQLFGRYQLTADEFTMRARKIKPTVWLTADEVADALGEGI